MKIPDHGRFAFSPIGERRTYDWPGGARLAVYIANNVERFAFAADEANRSGASCEALRREHFSQHPAGGVGRGKKNWGNSRFLSRHDLKMTKQSIGRIVRSGHDDADPTDDRRLDGVCWARAREEAAKSRRLS